MGPLKILGDHLRQNPENSLSGDYYSLDKLLERATLGRYAIVMVWIIDVLMLPNWILKK